MARGGLIEGGGLKNGTLFEGGGLIEVNKFRVKAKQIIQITNHINNVNIKQNNRYIHVEKPETADRNSVETCFACCGVCFIILIDICKM